MKLVSPTLKSSEIVGCSAWKREMIGSSEMRRKLSVVPILIRPAKNFGTPVNRRKTWASVTILVAWGRSSWPSGVRTTALPARSNSFRPSSCSNPLMRIEIAGWVMQRWSAATAKLPNLATMTKASSFLRSTARAGGPWNEAARLHLARRGRKLVHVPLLRTATPSIESTARHALHDLRRYH